MGAKLVSEVASKTNDIAGDGTTTATVLTQAIVREGLKMLLQVQIQLVFAEELNSQLKQQLLQLKKWQFLFTINQQSLKLLPFHHVVKSWGIYF